MSFGWMYAQAPSLTALLFKQTVVDLIMRKGRPIPATQQLLYDLFKAARHA